jgi:hypothetical protein
MRQIYRIFGAVIAAIVMQGALAGLAFAQGAPPAGQGAPPEGYAQQGADQGAAGPAGANRPLEMPVLFVTGIEVLRSAGDSKFDIIHVTGLASSPGWSSPQLVPFFYGKPADDVFDLQLIASSPQQSQKPEGFVPISAMFTLDAGHPFKGVRVRAADNALEVKQMPGVAKASARNSPKRANRPPEPPMSCARKTCRAVSVRSLRRTGLPGSCTTRTGST